MSVCLIYMTIDTVEGAKDIAQHLLDEKLIACANISSPVTSLYEWDGQMHSDEEFVVILKTHPKHYKAVERRIIELHPYDTPCVLRLETSDGHAPFVDWINTQTA